MTETFNPTANGWKIQRGYSILTDWQTAHDERENGASKSTVTGGRDLRNLKLRMRAQTNEAWWYLESFFRRHKDAVRFYFAWPEYVAPEHAAPTLEAVSGGSQGERTITVAFSWKNSAGETTPSPTGSLLVPANELIQVTIPEYPANVTQAVIYAAEDDAGNEVAQATLTMEETWTSPDAALLTGTAAVPSANTATETPLVKLVGPYKPARGVGLTRDVDLELQEVYS